MLWDMACYPGDPNEVGMKFKAIKEADSRAQSSSKAMEMVKKMKEAQ